MILPDCTVIIPTRNRANDLAKTVSIFQSQGLERTPVIIVDDSSDDANQTVEAAAGLTNCKIFFNRKRTGQAGARNIGISNAKTRYCLLLDDDCHIEHPRELLCFLNGAHEPATAIWRFETIREYDGYRDGIPETFPRGVIGSFIGFGALLNREIILSINGFRDILIYRREEEDLAIRLFRSGYDIMYVPGVRFIHRHLPNSDRSPAFVQEYEKLNTRNTILYYGLNFPFPYGQVEGILRSLKATFFCEASNRKTRIKGLFLGIVELMAEWGNRTPLTRKQVKQWKQLMESINYKILQLR